MLTRAVVSCIDGAGRSRSRRWYAVHAGLAGRPLIIEWCGSAIASASCVEAGHAQRHHRRAPRRYAIAIQVAIVGLASRVLHPLTISLALRWRGCSSASGLR
jgi:hypothetical protein